MAILYSGAQVTTDFTAASRTALVNALKDAMVAGGWSVVSGSSGDWWLGSSAVDRGAGYYAHSIRVRIRDLGSGNCIVAYLASGDGSLGGDDVGARLLFSDSITYRAHVNPYQVFVKSLGTVAARGSMHFGVPRVPSWISPDPRWAGWMSCDSQSDTDSTLRASFRRGLSHVHQTTSILWATSYIHWPNLISAANSVSILGQIVGGHEQTGADRWMDGSHHAFDPLIAWSPTSSGPSQIAGQIFDAIVVSRKAAALDERVSFDGRTWEAFSWAEAQTYPGSLYLVV